MEKEPGVEIPSAVSAPAGEVARANPVSNAWLPYYALAEQSAREREAERARLTAKATRAGRILTVSALLVVGLCYALLR
jgi:hypothetical protein